MKQIIIVTALFSLLTNNSAAQNFKTKFDDAVPVLNVGTFHMGYTSDANKVEFDEHSDTNIRQVHQIAEMIAKFKPTVIIVESTPAYQEVLESAYAAYLQDPKMKFENSSEINLLAFEVGRLSNTQKIYGVDYKESYNYSLFYRLPQKVDTITYSKYGEMMDENEKNYMRQQKDTSILAMLKMTNHPDYLDFLININADMLTYVSTKGKAEGATEAAKFYHRNLVMYSNINQIELTGSDRVFILMGATHTAFFNEWMKRSPKYKLVNVFDYLK